jgi:hypothetical protein
MFMQIAPSIFMKDAAVARSSLIDAIDNLCENDPDREATLERLVNEIARLAISPTRHPRR